uniref:C-type lectin domain-containing protein n=1 Tax=Nothoprocta perdicaria TaxID=30464 RepID=A0A8C6YXV2_NOTPE
AWDQEEYTRPLLYCPPGWSYYKLSCFKHFAQMRSWDEAEAQCQASQPGAHLAWVQEPREAATMRKVLSSYQRTQPVWIGLRLGLQPTTLPTAPPRTSSPARGT